MYYFITILTAVFLFVIISIFISIFTLPFYFTIIFLRKRYFNEKQQNKFTKRRIIYVLIFIIVSISSYEVYRAFYPNDDFYKNEFKENTGINLPDNCEILIKSASYPDIHGDYSSAAIVHVNEKDFIKILKEISNNKKFQIDTFSFYFGNEIRNNTNQYDKKEFIFRYSLNIQEDEYTWFSIGFNLKKKLITFNRNSS